MRCDRCGAQVSADEAVSRGGQRLCEDCLMDALSPAKACDPWAVKLAKGAKDAGGTGELKGLEKALYDLVSQRGRVPKEAAASLLGVRPAEVERAFAVLRHMELLRGDRRADGGADLVPFGAA
ncbi:MAG: hypothetical protein AB1578_00855 [Thermodesulfobacteriota bacterium]